MSRAFSLDGTDLSLTALRNFVFRRSQFKTLEISAAASQKVQASHGHLLAILETRRPLYGITTGLGDSCHRYIQPEASVELQLNLVRYLGCGTGALLSRDACRAIFLIHLQTHLRGFSAVSPGLIQQMKLFLERDWIPVMPREGSLGASGDLVPLSYLGRALIGEADVYDADGVIRPAKDLLQLNGLAPYKLKAKEGLSLVNGVSAMAGQAFVNLHAAEFLTHSAMVSTAWLCLCLGGRTEAFGALINEKAKGQKGQGIAARFVRRLLEDETYTATAGMEIEVKNSHTQGFIQDRYSLRCAPQILGPVIDTIAMAKDWLHQEINSTSDNPVIDEHGDVGMGGNFYGGYLSHSMDYLKICLANVADLLDRQNVYVVDDKSNRGLPPNLAAWSHIAEADRHLHHGLKGLHQAVSAITAEIMAKATPQSIFSRSSESHNQDKVSLGMGGAMQCADQLEQVFRVQILHLTCLAQALDLRGIKIKGKVSRAFYDLIRRDVPFVKQDQALGEKLGALERNFKEFARSGEYEWPT